MNLVWKAAALCVTGAILAALLKKKVPEMALVVSLAVVAAVGLLVVRWAGSVLAVMDVILRSANLPSDLFRPLIKTVAIAMTCRVGSDLCRDAGESAMASVLEISGSFGAIIVSLPLLEAVWDMLQSVL